MTRRLTIGDLVEKHALNIRSAFLASLNEVTSRIRLLEITKALQRFALDEAIDLIRMERTAFRVLEDAITTAYQDGGVSTAANLTGLKNPSGPRLILRFDTRNPRAEQWLRDHAANLITRIVEEQKLNIRQHLAEGMAAGRNPRALALRLVGKINKATGRREGGIIGLSAPQEHAVRKAEEELRSGLYNDFLQRKVRDKRFDRSLLKAGREDRKLSASDVSRIIARYNDKLLKVRGDTIARTEALASLHAAQHQALLQLVDSGQVAANVIRRLWDSAGDTRTRPAHVAADSQTVGLNDQFNIGGRFMAYPGDPAGGPENIINCRCFVRIKINFLATLR